MKKIFSIVFLALVVSGTIFFGDVREAKADWGSSYVVYGRASLYILEYGVPCVNLYVELHDQELEHAFNPCDVLVTNFEGAVPIPSSNGRYFVRIPLAGAGYHDVFIDEPMVIVDIGGM